MCNVTQTYGLDCQCLVHCCLQDDKKVCKKNLIPVLWCRHPSTGIQFAGCVPISPDSTALVRTSLPNQKPFAVIMFAVMIKPNSAWQSSVPYANQKAVECHSCSVRWCYSHIGALWHEYRNSVRSSACFLIPGHCLAFCNTPCATLWLLACICIQVTFIWIFLVQTIVKWQTKSCGLFMMKMCHLS